MDWYEWEKIGQIKSVENQKRSVPCVWYVCVNPIKCRLRIICPFGFRKGMPEFHNYYARAEKCFVCFPVVYVLRSGHKRVHARTSNTSTAITLSLLSYFCICCHYFSIIIVIIRCDRLGKPFLLTNFTVFQR